ACVAPTLIQEPGDDAKAVEAKREELAGVPAGRVLSADEVRAIREIGDNRGSMALKGAAPQHDGPEQPDRWEVSERLAAVAARWDVEPGRDLVQRPVAPAPIAGT
ncbi:MAG: hypothetical protein H0U80_02405, partial [Solirubrobacterales bacterium]|nr:hypothetical protein [Solirubrobacterales bacterium]